MARTPTISVCWLPTMSRERKSRPLSSAPSGKPGSGPGIGFDWGRTLSSSRPAAGSWGAIHGEMIAKTTKTSVMAAPTRKTGSRRSRRQALAMSETPGASSTVPASSTTSTAAGCRAVPLAARGPAELAASSSMRCLRLSIGFSGFGGRFIGCALSGR